MRLRTWLWLLLLGAACVQAAEPFTNPAEEDRVASEQEGESAVPEADEQADDEADADDTAANTRGSGDFVPSVQISEDLSVSFPTDI